MSAKRDLSALLSIKLYFEIQGKWRKEQTCRCLQCVSDVMPGTSYVIFNPHKNIMRQYYYCPHFTEKETRGSEEGRNLFKIAPLVSSRIGIKTQVCLLPDHFTSNMCEGLGEGLLN